MRTEFLITGKIVLLSLVLIFVSCEPSSKEDYLSMFNEFVTQIEEEHEEYGDNKWEIQKERYDKLTNEWYNKFKGDLSSKEKFNIKKLQVKFLYHYNMHKADGMINDAIDAVTETDIEKEANDIKNELEDLGEEAGEFFEEIMKKAEEATKDVIE